jgi:hypothetical protein
MNGIFRFEHEGRRVLGIDTGLSAEAFARARLASLVTDPGYIVSLRDSAAPVVELWRAGGTAELTVNGRPAPVMVVWGPDFAASAGHDACSLDEIVTREDGPVSRNGPGASTEALAAWVRARAALPVEGRPQPWPGAALVDEGAETVLFLPEAAARQAFDAAGGTAWINGAERWTHPDYSGEEAEVFTAAALLYFALSGSLPFPGHNRDTLREDIREGVFIPPRLAIPGLSGEPALLIAASLSPRARLKGQRPSLADLARLVGAAAENTADEPDGKRGLFRDVSPAEAKALEAERERFLRKRGKAVKTGRFLRRNRTAILGILVAAVIAALAAGSLIRAQFDRPSTRGMDPAAVVESYYNAITALDHEMLGACVTGGAGKDDINMVTNLYVISKVRQAYEAQEIFIGPEEWRQGGGGPSEKAVFGIGDLRIRRIEAETDGGGLAVYRAEYLFFNPYPDSNDDAAGDTAGNAVEAEKTPPPVPAGVPRQDELVLLKDKRGLWRIAEIRRTYNLPSSH